MHGAKDIISALGLEPLSVEGGFFKETYRSKIQAAPSPLPRCAGTCIYYLMTAKDISTWHKVASDEIWLYHAGSPAAQLLLFPDGTWTELIIGPDVMNGQVPQSLIPAGTWQAAVLLERTEESWGLFGAMVCPGFDYADFQGGSSKELAIRWPDAKTRMSALGLP